MFRIVTDIISKKLYFSYGFIVGRLLSYDDNMLTSKNSPSFYQIGISSRKEPLLSHYFLHKFWDYSIWVYLGHVPIPTPINVSGKLCVPVGPVYIISNSWG